MTNDKTHQREAELKGWEDGTRFAAMFVLACVLRVLESLGGWH